MAACHTSVTGCTQHQGWGMNEVCAGSWAVGEECLVILQGLRWLSSCRACVCNCRRQKAHRQVQYHCWSEAGPLEPCRRTANAGSNSCGRLLSLRSAAIGCPQLALLAALPSC